MGLLSSVLGVATGGTSTAISSVFSFLGSKFGISLIALATIGGLWTVNKIESDNQNAKIVALQTSLTKVTTDQQLVAAQSQANAYKAQLDAETLVNSQLNDEVNTLKSSWDKIDTTTKANNAAIVQQIQATQKASKLDPKQASSSLAVLNSQVACFSSQFTQGGSCVATLKSN